MSDDDLLGHAEIAELLDIRASTVRAYAARGQMPPADDLSVPDRPRWRRSTIESWLDARPGRGRWGPRPAPAARRGARQ